MKTFIRPREGLKVRAPDGSVLPAEGASIENNTYWRRRIIDGDVIIVIVGKKAGKKSK